MTRHALTILVLTLAACTKLNPPAKETNARTKGGATAPTAACVTGSTGVTPTGGQLVFSLAPADVDPCSVGVVVVGQDGNATLRVLDDHKVLVEGLPEGNHDVIVTGALAVQTAALAGGETLGVRLKGVAVSATTQTQLDSVELFPLGSVSGVARLQGQTDHTGIEVYIPGTQYAAHTGPSGAFEIKGVPKGEHNLVFEQLHYHAAQVGQVVVAPSANTAVPDVLIFPDLGEASPIHLDPAGTAAAPLTTLTVTYAVFPSGHPVLMRVGEDPNFANQAAQPFVSSGTYTFKLDDALKVGGKAVRKLYIQLVENGAESVLEAEVHIDLFLGLALGAEAAKVPALGAPSFVMTGIVLPEGADTMQVATKADFSDAKTVPAATTYKYDFPAGVASCGPHTIYVKVHMANGIESPVTSFAVEYECARKMSVAGAPKDRPFSMHLAGGGKFFIWGGEDENGDPTRDGYFYDVATDKWSPMGNTDAARPSARISMTAYWTGTEVLIWGGQDNSTPVNTGGSLYNPATGTWRAMSVISEPALRASAYTKFLGGKLIVMGGDDENYDPLDNGGVYDPATNQWTPIAHNGSGLPLIVDDQVYAASSAGVLTYGGSDVNTWDELDTGSFYSFTTHTWHTVPVGPAARAYHYMWDVGSKIAVWGGEGPVDDGMGGTVDVYYADGKLYDPQTNTWSAMATAPSSRYYEYTFMAPVADRMVVWGGRTNSSTYVWAGMTYDASTGAGGTWKTITATGAPTDPGIYDLEARAVCDRFGVWSQAPDSTQGAVTGNWVKLYDPLKDTWAPLSNAGPDAARNRLRLFCSDDSLVLWGGWEDDGSGGEDWKNDGTVYFLGAIH